MRCILCSALLSVSSLSAASSGRWAAAARSGFDVVAMRARTRFASGKRGGAHELVLRATNLDDLLAFVGSAVGVGELIAPSDAPRHPGALREAERQRIQQGRIAARA